MKFFTLAIVAFTFNAIAHFSAQGAGLPVLQSQNGDLLTINPTAQSDSICPGQSTQLFAAASGGSGGLYSFSWTSDPPGFTSNLQDPMVAPLVSTVYTVIVNDGAGFTTGTVTVTLKPLPEINLLPDNPNVRILNSSVVSVCTFDSLTIDAGNEGSSYLWSTGETTRTVLAQTSGISYDEQKYEVVVTNPVTGCSANASLTVQFSFSDCTYGMEENIPADRMSVYPNPSSDGVFTCSFVLSGSDLNMEVYSSLGALIKQDLIRTGKTGKSSATIDLSNQTPGVYFLRASDNKSVMRQKLIIRR